MAWITNLPEGKMQHLSISHENQKPLSYKVWSIGPHYYCILLLVNTSKLVEDNMPILISLYVVFLYISLQGFMLYVRLCYKLSCIVTINMLFQVEF
jgi:hypothetical protein